MKPGFCFEQKGFVEVSIQEEGNMDWMETVSALALVMFIIILLPATRDMMRNSSKGTSADWMGFVIPVAVVLLFIMLLVKLV